MQPCKGTDSARSHRQPELLAELQKADGVQADDIAIYDTVYGLEEDPEASPVQIKELEQGAETYVLFISASTVKGFAAAAGDIAGIRMCRRSVSGRRTRRRQMHTACRHMQSSDVTA